MRVVTGIILALLVSSLALTSPAATPRPAASEYLSSKGGGFKLELDDQRAVKSCKYALILTVRRTDKALFLRVRFENPADTKSPLIVDVDVKENEGQIILTSPEIRGLREKKNYKVEVLVFDSTERSKKIGQHTQYLQSQFRVP